MRDIEALGQPQRVQTELERQVRRIDMAALGDALDRGRGGDVTRGRTVARGAGDAPVTGELAVRTGAYAQVVAELPVVAVVPALTARACVGRNLVLVETRGGEPRLTGFLHLEGDVLAGERGWRPAREHGARFERE